MTNSILKVGDTVNWKGSWGTQTSKPAKVEHIEVIGLSVKFIEWDQINNRDTVVHFDNGHWAYGFQISQYNQ